MRILSLDLASHSGLIAAVTEKQITGSQGVDHRIGDAELIPVLESVLKKAGWSYQDLTHIACVVGPGGFTSLRVAVALANTLSHELKIPSCGIHLSDVYRARDRARSVWLHSTKKSELFIRDSDAEARCVSIDDLKGVLKKGTLWTGELIPEHQKIVTDMGLEQESLKSLDEILPAFLSAQSFTQQNLQPWYGRGW